MKLNLVQSFLLWAARRHFPPLIIRAAIPVAGGLNVANEHGSSLSEALIALNRSDVIAAMLHAGWKADSAGTSGWTAPTVACDLSAYVALDSLLGFGVSPDLRNKNHTTALMIAGRQNNLQAARTLLTARANPDLADCQGWTAAHWTVHKDRPQTLEMLELMHEFGADLETVDEHGRTCFELDSSRSSTLLALRERLRANASEALTMISR